MTDVDLFALHARATDSAFRLEAQPRYQAPAESAQLRAFAQGRPLPTTPGVARSMELIRTMTAAGRQVRRVHVLDLPLTDYLRYELAVYAENVAAGEEVRIADRAWHRDLAGLTEDFVLFDGDTDHASVVWMRYDAAGRVTEREYSACPADVDRCRRDRDVATDRSVPLDEFTVMVDAN